VAVSTGQSDPWGAAAQPNRTETQQPMESSLSDVLPWRREDPRSNGANAPAPGNSANADSHAPSEGDLPLNAPVTQAAQPQAGYANEYPAAGNYQPSGNASPSYPSTGYGSGQYPTTSTPAATYPTTSVSAPQYGAAPAYQARNPNPPGGYNSLPATNGGQPWNAPAADPAAGGGYPSTSTPAGGYAPPAPGAYSQPYSNESPREWRR
jgi:hypothetical protein